MSPSVGHLGCCWSFCSSQMCTNAPTSRMTDAADTPNVRVVCQCSLSLSLSLSTHLPLTGRNRPACGPCRNTDLVPGCLSEPVWRQEWGTFPKLRWPPPGKTQHQELHVGLKLHRDSTKLGPFPFLIQQDAFNKHETPPLNNCVK